MDWRFLDTKVLPDIVEDLASINYQRFKADKTENRNHKADKTEEYLHILVKT